MSRAAWEFGLSSMAGTSGAAFRPEYHRDQRRINARAAGRQGGPRSAWLRGAHPSADELEPGNAGNDQPDAAEPQRRRRFAEEVDAEHRRAHRADPSPDGVGGADRQPLEREP